MFYSPFTDSTEANFSVTDTSDSVVFTAPYDCVVALKNVSKSTTPAAGQKLSLGVNAPKNTQFYHYEYVDDGYGGYDIVAEINNEKRLVFLNAGDTINCLSKPATTSGTLIYFRVE